MATVQGRPIIDFQVLNSGDPKLLIVADNSEYKSLRNNTSTISIKLPGSNNFQLYPFPKNKVTTYNSNTLHLSCVQPCADQAYVDLPDGIYTILVEVSPNDIYSKQRYYLKTDQFKLELDKILVKASIEYTSKDRIFREDIMDINFMVETAKAFTSQGDFHRAQKCFQEAQKLLEKYSDCINCI